MISKTLWGVLLVTVACLGCASEGELSDVADDDVPAEVNPPDTHTTAPSQDTSVAVDVALDVTPPDAKPGIASSARFATDVTTASGATLKVLIVAPSVPAKAAVILLEGGDGLVTIQGPDTDPVVQSIGFLARNADRFASEGLLVALVGAPSDYPDGLDIDYRISARQSEDVAAVLDWLNARLSLPTWVLGMSKGSFSAANTAIRLDGSLAGFAVCSASTSPPAGTISQTHPNGIIDMGLGQITARGLVVGHVDDACPGTPPAGVAKIASALTSSPSVAQKLFEGGEPPQSHECAPHSPHGYFGLDAEVVAYMAGVMLR